MRISRGVVNAVALIALLIIMGVIGVRMCLPSIERWSVGLHQKGVTRSLAAWVPETANITNDASAIHAAEVIGYMSTHYVPGPGYSGPIEIEAALERQRWKSIEIVAASLERYTGLDYGTNVDSWIQWAKSRKGSEPDGPANLGSPRPFQAESKARGRAKGSQQHGRGFAMGWPRARATLPCHRPKLQVSL
jgi:hypothetical protein